MSTTQVLESDTDFLVAALNQYGSGQKMIQKGVDYGGIVEGYSPESIKIAGGRFIRQRFEFRAYIK
ncbi:hypothetical protein [Paenibacillus jilunlii]|uniref:Uncharacterized protein n=1 Tax=Paenibacillus jilunlii TaxID=682956 RepID=A0A1G9GQC5_9BACL|nr:hypothetical protein [Paenibacillus jilunlii]KWX73875.1 hypothetical protein AML91_16585 [Paenibacillus jilunlii]SDL02876.1 hypothetical protein SAMN05216191_101518 [Paenibacillus jilunlii]